MVKRVDKYSFYTSQGNKSIYWNLNKYTYEIGREVHYRTGCTMPKASKPGERGCDAGLTNFDYFCFLASSSKTMGLFFNFGSWEGGQSGGQPNGPRKSFSQMGSDRWKRILMQMSEFRRKMGVRRRGTKWEIPKLFSSSKYTVGKLSSCMKTSHEIWFY